MTLGVGTLDRLGNRSSLLGAQLGICVTRLSHGCQSVPVGCLGAPSRGLAPVVAEDRHSSLGLALFWGWYQCLLSALIPEAAGSFFPLRGPMGHRSSWSMPRRPGSKSSGLAGCHRGKRLIVRHVTLAGLELPAAAVCAQDQCDVPTGQKIGSPRRPSLIRQHGIWNPVHSRTCHSHQAVIGLSTINQK